MDKITLSTPSAHSEIICGKGAFSQFLSEFKSGKCFVITDSNVHAIYGRLIKDSFPEAEVFVIRAGERSKNYNVLLSILKKMIEVGITRKSTVIAFGGGVVGDIAGLSASLFMRGTNLVQIPTTLLSQVDSSVGGKTAVDLCGVKNAVGTFYQPSRVVVDPVFLRTLPAREMRCGLGEIIKYGALNGQIYSLLKENAQNLTDEDFLRTITSLCIKHKAKVVTQDERDISGERKSLNLGHTTAHAFELNYKRKSHGEFVLIGTYYELFIATNCGVCSLEYAQEIKELIKRVIKNIPIYDDASAAKFDKKNLEQSAISLIVPKAEGEWGEITLNFEQYSKLICQCAQAIRSGKW